MVYCLSHGGDRTEVVSVRAWFPREHHLVLLPCGTDLARRIWEGAGCVDVGDGFSVSGRWLGLTQGGLGAIVVGVGRAKDDLALPVLRILQLMLFSGADRGGGLHDFGEDEGEVHPFLEAMRAHRELGKRHRLWGGTDIAVLWCTFCGGLVTVKEMEYSK
ncbi:hypothetical protein E2C01_019118 [Portunus trituberculatus]|uniref:Uncharacterized protein n=1 Tax=Portunus trituberculatus TaxID=210409 RepID=A0A5B7DWF3_PORTR|nr:hypothetical protein [Portunus trituberculatus]